VFDFWENKVVARAKDSYTTAPLENLASALVRITPLTGDAPLLVGSNLHLSMGATEIDGMATTADGIVVTLSDAGAQDGSLTFYSKSALAAGSAENCEIAGVESLGDNLWRVDLKGRLWGKPQSVSLAYAK
jgi:alpha-galactosidase